MELRDYLSVYLEGILNMASSISTSIGPSYVKVDCYEKENLKENFCKNYKINENDLNLIETSSSLKASLLEWFYNEPKIVEGIEYWFNIKLRGTKKVYLSEEKLINTLDKKQKDFYTLDDVIFIECRKYIFVFLLGNNE